MQTSSSDSRNNNADLDSGESTHFIDVESLKNQRKQMKSSIYMTQTNHGRWQANDYQKFETAVRKRENSNKDEDLLTQRANRYRSPVQSRGAPTTTNDSKRTQH